MIEWLHKHYIFIVTVLVLLVYGMTYMGGAFEKPVRSDGAGYYAYLPSFILYGDPSYERDAIEQYGGAFPRWTYVREYPPTGRYLNSLNIGLSLMILPFFLIAHALTAWFGFPWAGGYDFLQMRFPPDGYSFFYQHAAGLAGAFYFLIGFALLKRLLDGYFSKGVVLGVLTSLLFGTNLLYYGAADTVTAHPFTFALAVALMGLTRRWYASPRHLPTVVLLGVVASLLFLVRPLNVVMFVWPVVFGLWGWGTWLQRGRFWLNHFEPILVMAMVALALLIPQFAIWKYSSGHFVVKAYQHMDGSDFGIPNVFSVVLGLQKGMLPWFPIFLLMYLGIYPLGSKTRNYLFPVLLLLLVYPLVIGSYQGWQTAGGFGNRYLVDLIPFAAFPLAALYASADSRRKRGLLYAVGGCCIVWACFLFTLFLRKEISYYGLDAEALHDIFWWRKEAFMTWWNTR